MINKKSYLLYQKELLFTTAEKIVLTVVFVSQLLVLGLCVI